MSDACVHDAEFFSGRTDGRTNKRILGVGRWGVQSERAVLGSVLNWALHGLVGSSGYCTSQCIIMDSAQYWELLST